MAKDLAADQNSSKMKTEVQCSRAGKSPRRLSGIPGNCREIGAGNLLENHVSGGALCSTDRTEDRARSLARRKMKISSVERGREKSRAMMALVRDEKQPKAGFQTWAARDGLPQPRDGSTSGKILKQETRSDWRTTKSNWRKIRGYERCYGQAVTKTEIRVRIHHGNREQKWIFNRKMNGTHHDIKIDFFIEFMQE
jgi:hypothetical protein